MSSSQKAAIVCVWRHQRLCKCICACLTLLWIGQHPTIWLVCCICMGLSFSQSSRCVPYLTGCAWKHCWPLQAVAQPSCMVCCQHGVPWTPVTCHYTLPVCSHAILASGHGRQHNTANTTQHDIMQPSLQLLIVFVCDWGSAQPLGLANRGTSWSGSESLQGPHAQLSNCKSHSCWRCWALAGVSADCAAALAPARACV